VIKEQPRFYAAMSNEAFMKWLRDHVDLYTGEVVLDAKELMSLWGQSNHNQHNYPPYEVGSGEPSKCLDCGKVYGE